jgi:ABC-type glycerol-3-phosphate transport system permease component
MTSIKSIAFAKPYTDAYYSTAWPNAVTLHSITAHFITFFISFSAFELARLGSRHQNYVFVFLFITIWPPRVHHTGLHIIRIYDTNNRDYYTYRHPPPPI